MSSKYAEEEEEEKKYRGISEGKSEGKGDSDSGPDANLYSDTDSDESEEDDMGTLVDAPTIRTGRRGTVMAAPIEVDPDWEPPVYEKSEEERQSINDALTANLLFAKLDDRELDIVVNAMERLTYEEGENLIVQGDEGDRFYVLEEGTAEVFVDGVGCVMRIAGQGSGLRNYVGELALLYDAPRAATVTATSPVVAWALDRLTFKRILQDATQKQRLLYRGFLSQVSILETLDNTERLTIADALRPRLYSAGDTIISEGKQGDEFFIIEDGEVRVTKDVDGEEVEVSNRLGSGDYFGELALLNNDTRKATVVAVRPTRCLLLDRNTFKRLLGPLETLLRENVELYNKYVEDAISHK